MVSACVFKAPHIFFVSELITGPHRHHDLRRVLDVNDPLPAMARAISVLLPRFLPTVE